MHFCHRRCGKPFVTWFRIATLPAIILMAALGVPEHFAAAAEQQIVIPAIFSRWKPAGEEGKAETTTIDEIGKCMGSDVKVRELYDDLTSLGAQLERESGEVASETEAVKSKRAELQAADAKLAESVKSYDAQAEALERRRAEIEKGRKNNMTTAEAKTFNNNVALFNKEVAAQRNRDDALKAQSEDFNAQVAAYNAVAAKSNEKVNAFNARMAPYVAKSKQFEDLQASYKQRCVGERRIVK